MHPGLPCRCGHPVAVHQDWRRHRPPAGCRHPGCDCPQFTDIGDTLVARQLNDLLVNQIITITSANTTITGWVTNIVRGDGLTHIHMRTLATHLDTELVLGDDLPVAITFEL